MKVARIFFLFLIGLFFSVNITAQTLVVNAGNYAILCPGTTATIGGSPTATGGLAPYSYSWFPNTNISSTTVANPTVFPTQPTWYYVTVTDAAGNSAIDSVGIDLYSIYAFNGGQDTSICIGGTATLGGVNNTNAGGVTYSWTPTTFLDNPSAPRPISSTTFTITYSVIITSPNCPSKSYSMTVTVNPLPTVTACCPATIYEGQSVIVNATGATNYTWSPFNNTISDAFAAQTTLEPIVTTTYYVYGQDINGCLDWDSLTITVIPSSELLFYNTFSPNADGINDYFYIGNAYKYPDCRLEVFTRTGQLVYAKTAYDNTWDGTNYGDKLPEATYYYSFTPGDGTPTKFGNVTILR